MYVWLAHFNYLPYYNDISSSTIRVYDDDSLNPKYVCTLNRMMLDLGSQITRVSSIIIYASIRFWHTFACSLRSLAKIINNSLKALIWCSFIRNLNLIF